MKTSDYNEPPVPEFFKDKEPVGVLEQMQQDIKVLRDEIENLKLEKRI